MQQLENFIKSPFNILFACLLLNCLLHLPFFNEPPQSVHVWRQCNTLAVSRNFSREEMNIFKPRVDRRLETNGVTGMQFPAYEYLVATGYLIFGEHNYLHRIISFLLIFAGTCAMYFLCLLVFSSPVAAALGAWSFTWSPDLFYFGISALPDILALSSSIAGLYFFYRWFYSNQFRYYLLSLFLVTLAGLTKIQFLAIGFPIAVSVLLYKQYDTKKIIQLIVFAFVSVGLTLWWYLYALQLIESSGLKDFGLEFRPVDNWGTGINIITQNLLSDVPELLLNYASTVFFIIGCACFFKYRNWQSKWFLPFLAWTLALFAYHIIELKQMDVHSYYMMPYLPLLFLIIAYGGSKLYVTKYKAVFFVLMLVQPVLAAVRIIPARWMELGAAVPVELYYPTSKERLINAIPDNELCIVGPDVSGCIYFYFLEKKGFGFANTEQLFYIENGKSVLESYINRGAKYLISNDTTLLNHPQTVRFADRLIMKEGNFIILKLKK